MKRKERDWGLVYCHMICPKYSRGCTHQMYQVSLNVFKSPRYSDFLVIAFISSQTCDVTTQNIESAIT